MFVYYILTDICLNVIDIGQYQKNLFFKKQIAPKIVYWSGCIFLIVI